MNARIAAAAAFIERVVADSADPMLLKKASYALYDLVSYAGHTGGSFEDMSELADRARVISKRANSILDAEAERVKALLAD